MHPTLTVSLSAIAENYQRLSQQFTGEAVAGVVKANAYGLGVVPVALCLIEQGCQLLFVATLEEALALKMQLAEALPPQRIPPIAVFHGPYKGEEQAFIAQDIIPVINHITQLERWLLLSAPASHAPYMLHVDSGMCRLGLSLSDVRWLDEHGSHLLARKPLYLLSHLACANQREHPKNREQLERLTSMRRYFPDVPVSFCNSSGLFLDAIFHHQLGRPGCALYGINPASWLDANPMRQVAELTAPIVMVRHLDTHESIGYGATCERSAGSRIAIVQMGYADGFLRCLSNKARVHVGDVACEVVGRVSMDMIAVDVSHLPDAALSQAQQVTLMGQQQTVDELAEAAGTIGYEIFTRLGSRVQRIYR